MRKKVISFLFLLNCCIFLTAGPQDSSKTASGKSSDAVRQEEADDYYQKWLKQDVVYIITPEEEAVFKSLTTPEEKERFIEQFWLRRDPDPRTQINEFKEEHYRRIAYANERFTSGMQGWMSDRGKIYIIHGPPDQIVSKPAGGTYNRPMHEGGGSTQTFPFEIWWYRHIEGLGSDIELEFVDPSMSGQFRLARRPEEKDALLHTASGGPTLVEEMGYLKKEDRPFFTPQNRETYPLLWLRAKDDPFEVWNTYFSMQKPKAVKYKDLMAQVTIEVTYETLPFSARQDYFKLNDFQVLVPITVEFQNKDLTFQEEGPAYVARIAIYGVITSLGNRIVTEFEDEVTSALKPEILAAGLQGISLYQKTVPLDKKTRYKLDLVVKDLNSGKVGVVRQAIVPPAFNEGELAVSSMLLSDFVQTLSDVPKTDQMFVLGDLWIRPNLSNIFSPDQGLGVYFQLYNVGIDQSSQEPSLEVTYRVYKGNRPTLEVVDQSGEAVHYFSPYRLVLFKQLPVNLLNPGEYRLEVQIRDKIKDRILRLTDSFELTRPNSRRQGS